MSTSAKLLIVAALIIGFVLYLKAHDPATFSRLQAKFSALWSPAPDTSSGPSPLFSSLAAPATRAASDLANTASNALNGDQESAPATNSTPTVQSDGATNQTTPASP